MQDPKAGVPDLLGLKKYSKNHMSEVKAVEKCRSLQFDDHLSYVADDVPAMVDQRNRNYENGSNTKRL